jgi:hypothetical protein
VERAGFRISEAFRRMVWSNMKILEALVLGLIVSQDRSDMKGGGKYTLSSRALPSLGSISV